jgi:hypothetical protein
MAFHDLDRSTSRAPAVDLALEAIVAWPIPWREPSWRPGPETCAGSSSRLARFRRGAPGGWSPASGSPVADRVVSR